MPKTPAWAVEPRRAAALFGGAAAVALLLQGGSVHAQHVPDLVARDVLRVCADPADLPFSNRDEQGFENKIAHIVADELKIPLRYYWLPQGPGFVRNTLSTGLCDLIVGYASGSGVVDHTNPYYTSTYVLVVKAGGPLDGVERLEDSRLTGRKLGVIAATPPVDHLLRLGLIADAKTYSLLVDRRYSSPAEEALGDLAAGTIDGALLWGPIGGYFATRSPTLLKVTPLLGESARPSMAFRITFGIRPNETEWKHRLNAVIRKRQKDIDAALASYGVPLVSKDTAPPEAPVQLEEPQ